VEDPDLAGGLAVTVDAAVALLQAVGVPGDFVVDQPVAVPLQVDALAGGVGGEQDADRRQARVGLELGLDPLPLPLVHAAVQHGQPLAAEPAGDQALL
jgi:hypothetical protein